MTTSVTPECLVENVTAAEGTVYYTQVLTGWSVGVTKSVGKKKSVAGQFAVINSWTRVVH